MRTWEIQLLIYSNFFSVLKRQKCSSENGHVWGSGVKIQPKYKDRVLKSRQEVYRTVVQDQTTRDSGFLVAKYKTHEG